MGSDDKAEILAAIDALGERIEARISVMEKKIDAIASHSLAPAELRALLGSHNRLEEGEAGLYAECDRLLARRAGEILARIAAAPAVPLAAHFDGPGVHRTAAAALEASRQARRRD